DRIGNAVRRHVTIHPVVRRVGRNADRPGDIAVAGREVVCAWAAWNCRAHQDAADLLKMASREVSISPSIAKQRWRHKRWSHLMAAVTALLSLDNTALGRSVRALDALTTGANATVVVPSDLVDETVAVLAEQWRHADREGFAADGFHTVIDAGGAS